MNIEIKSTDTASDFRFADNYDGMEIFGSVVNKLQTKREGMDAVDEVIRNSGKTYGEADGRHKRP